MNMYLLSLLRQLQNLFAQRNRPFEAICEWQHGCHSQMASKSSIFPGIAILQLSLLINLFCLPLFAYPHNLIDLEERINEDFDWVGEPEEWTQASPGTFDVAIIGGGMAGLSSAFALKKLGIHNLIIFDQNVKGCEGPWTTYGQMKNLITSKYASGPSLNFPSLTFQAWYEANWGKEAWSSFMFPSAQAWKEYLDWFRQTLKLPVANESKLIRIEPMDENGFLLELSHGESQKFIHAKKVILATGRLGGGGANIPKWIQNVDNKWYSHSTELFPYCKLKNKAVAVIGCGASALDVALKALQEGATKVDLLFRRKELPFLNLFEKFAHPGFEQGYFDLKDATKCNLVGTALAAGSPPNAEVVQRAGHYAHFTLSSSTDILGAVALDNSILLQTSQGSFTYDHLLLATGFAVDLAMLAELHRFSHLIKLWQDEIPALAGTPLALFPYLDKGYRFVAKEGIQAPFLQNIHCFNYAALLSHGLNSSSIDALSAGSERLAREIAADFLKEP